MKEIFSPLQPTIYIEIVPFESFSISIKKGTHFHFGSSLLKIFNGTFDTRAALSQQLSLGEFWKNELYLFIQTGICYAIADKTASWNGYFKQNYFLLIFVLALYTCLVIETIIKSLSKKYKVDVMMDLLRALIGNATLWEPKKSFKRIIFMLIVLSFILITSYLQSELTSVIVPTPKEKIELESIKDLINYNYVVFANNDFQQYFITSNH